MKALAKASRINTAMQVIQQMTKGMTVVDACRTVGLPRSSFYDIVEKNPDAFCEIREIIDANNREQLRLILQSKTEMLRKVIDDGLADTTKPRDRLEIYSKLDEREKAISDGLAIDDPNEKRAQEFLRTLPRQEHGQSRLTATQTTITIEG